MEGGDGGGRWRGSREKERGGERDREERGVREREIKE